VPTTFAALMVIATSRMRVCAGLAAPVLVAAFGWTPTAHAAGPGASLPAVASPVSAVPAVSTSTVVSTASSVTRSVAGAVSAVTTRKAPVVATASHVVTRVATAVTGTSTTATPTHVARVAPAPKATGATKRAVRSQRGHGVARAARGATTRLADGFAPGVAVHRRAEAAAGPSAQVLPELPGRQPPPGFFPGASAGGGSGFALLFIALAAALSALAAPALGRRLMPSIPDGRDCALTLDLERPD
jgi:hypothetical protein